MTLASVLMHLYFGKHYEDTPWVRLFSCLAVLAYSTNIFICFAKVGLTFAGIVMANVAVAAIIKLWHFGSWIIEYRKIKVKVCWHWILSLFSDQRSSLVCVGILCAEQQKFSVKDMPFMKVQKNKGYAGTDDEDAADDTDDQNGDYTPRSRDSLDDVRAE